MATVTKEATTPEWAVKRDGVLANNRKNMDRNAMTPLDQLPLREQAIMQGIWLAYNHTLEDPTRCYVHDRLVIVARRHMALKSPFPQTPVYVDFGAGNGRISKKVIEALSHVADLKSFLVEQSAPALESAWQYFNADTPWAIARIRSGGLVLRSLQKHHPSNQSLTFLQEDITQKTTIPSGSVDLLTCVNVFHHLDYIKLLAATAEINRVLRSGGRFVLVDTHRLPDKGFRKTMVYGAIKRAVNAERMIARAARQGKIYTETQRIGIRQFTQEDAYKAFEDAMTLKEFHDLMSRSALAPSLHTVEELRSPHFLRRLIYPVLNYATGVKK